MVDNITQKDKTEITKNDLCDVKKDKNYGENERYCEQKLFEKVPKTNYEQMLLLWG